MLCLSLDQALRTTGFAIFENQRLKDYGTFTLPTSIPIEQRLGSYWSELNDLKAKFDPDFIFFEDTQNQQNAETFRKLCYVEAATILWCYFNNIKFQILSPSHWRSVLKEKCGISFGRKREEQKKATIDFVIEYFNENVTTDEADAISLGYAGILERGRNESAF